MSRKNTELIICYIVDIWSFDIQRRVGLKFGPFSNKMKAFLFLKEYGFEGRLADDQMKHSSVNNLWGSISKVYSNDQIPVLKKPEQIDCFKLF